MAFWVGACMIRAMNFHHAVEYLLSLGHETLTMKLGLRNTELLLEALGNPHQAFFSAYSLPAQTEKALLQ